MPRATTDDGINQNPFPHTLSRLQLSTNRIMQTVESSASAFLLLQELGSRLLVKLIEIAPQRRLFPGERVFTPKVNTKTIYLVLEGAVDILHSDPKQISILETRNPGTLIGESALLAGSPRVTAARANQWTTLLEIRPKILAKLLKRDEQASGRFARLFRRSLANKLIEKSSVLSNLPIHHQRIVANHCKVCVVPPHIAVLPRNTKPKGIYFVLAGRLSAKAPSDAHLKTFRAGESFGESPLLEERQSLVTVRTDKRSWLLMLPGDCYRRIL